MILLWKRLDRPWVILLVVDSAVVLHVNLHTAEELQRDIGYERIQKDNVVCIMKYVKKSVPALLFVVIFL